jgi:hypothetical protein
MLVSLLASPSFLTLTVNRSSGGLGSGKEPKRGGIGKAMSKGLFKAKNPAQIQRQEDETRARMNSASEQFKRAVQENQAVKQEFFNLHLPKILRVSLVPRICLLF